MTVQEFFASASRDAPTRRRPPGCKTRTCSTSRTSGSGRSRSTTARSRVTEGAGEADCTISASEETLVKIAKGEANPTTAYMTGKLKISGDMGAALKLQKLF